MAWLPSFNAQSCCAHLWWTMKAREINGKYYKKHATHRMFRGHSAGIFSFSTPMPTSFHSAHILYLNLLLYILKQISAPPPFFFCCSVSLMFLFFSLLCLKRGLEMNYFLRASVSITSIDRRDRGKSWPKRVALDDMAPTRDCQFFQGDSLN